ncbi:MAG: RNA 2',3'-cyclic phosphodiesterase [Candidatus Aminicenantales bacterium]|jgi:2'-5' RNA ligase
MRTFVAVDLDPAMKATLSDFIKGLKKINDRDVSWVHEEALHLTIKFLGEIAPAGLEAIKAALADITRPVRSFPLILKGTGYFPASPKAIRVFWAGVFQQPTLMGLQREIDFRLQAQGFPAENTPFNPHLTLGRVKAPQKLRDVLAEIERHRYSAFGQMTVDRIKLFESRLKPAGAEHSVLAEFPLT